MRTSFPILIALLLASPAYAVKVADITRISGQRPNVMTGLGLVVGLNGTGDGGDYLPAIRPLAGMLSKFADPTTVKDLQDADNVALVLVTARIPKDGVVEGDQLDVYVMSQGAARSLKGGRLFVTPLGGPIPNSGVLALAEGPVTLEDPSTPTSGVVKGGAVMEVPWRSEYVDAAGRFTLVLDDPSASWSNANTIAMTINGVESLDGETLAVAVDPKTVVVTIPDTERAQPDSFISRVQQQIIPKLRTEARVQVNERTGTLIVTGDVEISPVVISHKGLTITTVEPKPVPTPRSPVLNSKDVVTLDTARQGGAKLQDLVSALEQLKVPAEDRITIVKELHKTGKLHAKLITE